MTKQEIARKYNWEFERDFIGEDHLTGTITISYGLGDNDCIVLDLPLERVDKIVCLHNSDILSALDEYESEQRIIKIADILEVDEEEAKQWLEVFAHQIKPEPEQEGG